MPCRNLCRLPTMCGQVHAAQRADPAIAAMRTRTVGMALAADLASIEIPADGIQEMGGAQLRMLAQQRLQMRAVRRMQLSTVWHTIRVSWFRTHDPAICPPPYLGPRCGRRCDWNDSGPYRRWCLTTFVPACPTDTVNGAAVCPLRNITDVTSEHLPRLPLWFDALQVRRHSALQDLRSAGCGGNARS